MGSAGWLAPALLVGVLASVACMSVGDTAHWSHVRPPLVTRGAVRGKCWQDRTKAMLLAAATRPRLHEVSKTARSWPSPDSPTLNRQARMT